MYRRKHDTGRVARVERDGIVRTAVWLILVLPSLAAPALAAGPHTGCRHHCRIPFLYDHRGFDGVPLIPRAPQVYGIPPDTIPEYQPQTVPMPTPVPGPAPAPQGFALDVPVTPDRPIDDTDPSGHPTLTRYRDVADALARCWAPPATFDDSPWRQATLRVSFKRDGTVNGAARIPYAAEGLTAKARSDLTASLEAALHRCTPLAFSPSLGAAVAGQIFALRFIEQDQDR